MVREEEMMFYESMLEMIHKIVRDFAAEYHGALDDENRKDAYKKAMWQLSILRDYVSSLNRVNLLRKEMMESIHRRIDDAMNQVTKHVEDWDMIRDGEKNAGGIIREYTNAEISE